MKIIVDDSTRLFEIQEEFRSHFPFLKLEFFEFDPTGFINPSRENLINDNRKTVGEIRHVHRSGYVSLNGQQKTSTLEHQFMENFGICAQVFRRSGDRWLETTTTDTWTLSEQNKKGEEMSNPVLDQVASDYEQYYL